MYRRAEKGFFKSFFIFLAEIRLKTVERVQLKFHLRLWLNIVQVGRNFSKLAQIGAEKTNHVSNFGQLGRYSTKIVVEIQLRAFDRF
jgi:hypothetical protein